MGERAAELSEAVEHGRSTGQADEEDALEHERDQEPVQEPDAERDGEAPRRAP